MYLDVVGSGIPFLAQGVWHPRALGLAHFDVEVLDVTHVVLTKLKRFSATDRADIEAMVSGGHVEHARLLQGVIDTIAWYRFDARSNLLPSFVANFHRAERDWFGREESRIELPDDLDR